MKYNNVMLQNNRENMPHLNVVINTSLQLHEGRFALKYTNSISQILN